MSPQDPRNVLPDPHESVSASSSDPLEPFNSRLPRSLQRRLRVYAALHDRKIQDVLGSALDEYLRQREE